MARSLLRITDGTELTTHELVCACTHLTQQEAATVKAGVKDAQQLGDISPCLIVALCTGNTDMSPSDLYREGRGCDPDRIARGK